MSFSKDVKEELVKLLPKSRHCQLAQLAGMVCFSKKDEVSVQNQQLKLVISDEIVLRIFFTLLRKTLNINSDVTEFSKEHFDKLAYALKITDDGLMDKLMLQQYCCKQSFIRGAFLVAGSISDPQKGYHFEIVTGNESLAQLLIQMIASFDISAKVVERNQKYVVYLKDGAQIVEILRVMQASHSVMELENIRVVKEVRESINRKVNCETANISKTVNAALRQIEDIRLIQDKVGLESLPDSLYQIAKLRLDNPDTSLQDLGEMVTPPLGKSGVNHRLKKISAIADTYRET